MFRINDSDKFIEDSGIIEIIRGRSEVRIDKTKQFKVEIFPFLDQSDERVDDLYLRQY